MKNITISLFISIILMYACNSSSKNHGNSVKNDLRKISWIEGNWKGMYNGKPFYEIYKITNDTTLEITSYEWTGTDSTKTSRSYVYKRNDNYYLGDSLNWKVTAITDSSILMGPNYKASNSILWKKRDNSGWDAILGHSKGERVYNMEKVFHFTTQK